MTRPIADIVAGLRAKMVDVTPGPWTLVASSGSAFVAGPSTNPVIRGDDVVACPAYSDRTNADDIGNMAYIAACDPDTIRAVLDALEAAQVQTDADDAFIAGYKIENETLTKAIDVPRAQLAAVTKERDAARNANHLLSEQAHDHAALILTYQEDEFALKAQIAQTREESKSSRTEVSTIAKAVNWGTSYQKPLSARVGELVTFLEAAQSERDAALRDLAEAANALEPFAKIARLLVEDDTDLFHVEMLKREFFVSAGDFRVALAALSRIRKAEDA